MLDKFFNKIFYSIVIVLVLVAATIRIYKLDVGIQGDDVFFYYETAYDWFKGKYYITLHYRPFVHLLYSKAMHIFGGNDITLKIVNTLLCFMNSILMFYISSMFCKSNKVAIIAALSYLFIPYTIYESRQELTHIMTTTFVLASFLIRILNTDYKKIKYFVSGAFLGIATHVHPDVGPLGLLFVVSIVYEIFQEEKYNFRFQKIFFERTKNEVQLFCIGYIIPFLYFILRFGLSNVITNLKKGYLHQAKVVPNLPFLENIYRYIRGYVAYIEYAIGNYWFILIIMSLYIVYINRKIVHRTILLVLFGTPLMHIFVCLITVKRKFIPRLAHLDSAFLIMLIFYCISLIEDRKKKIITTAVSFFLILIGTGIFNLNINELYQVSIYKQLFKEGIKVDRDNRILITPSIFHWYREGFNSPAYFDGNAVYLSKYRYGNYKFEESLRSNFNKIIRENKVKYIAVLMNDKNIRKDIKNHDDMSAFIPRIYGIELKDYTLENEYKFLNEVLNKEKFRKKIVKNKYEIYEVIE